MAAPPAPPPLSRPTGNPFPFGGNHSLSGPNHDVVRAQQGNMFHPHMSQAQPHKQHEFNTSPLFGPQLQNLDLQDHAYEISDIRKERMSDSAARDYLSTYVVMRLEKCPDQNNFDSEGLPARPNWDQTINSEVRDLSQQDIIRRVRDLNRSNSKPVVARKAKLSLELQRQLELVRDELDRRDDSSTWQHVLVQFDEKLKRLEKGKDDYYVTKGRKGLVMNKDTGRHGKHKWERISVTAYFKRTPRNEVNARELLYQNEPNDHGFSGYSRPRLQAQNTMPNFGTHFPVQTKTLPALETGTQRQALEAARPLSPQRQPAGLGGNPQGAQQGIKGRPQDPVPGSHLVQGQAPGPRNMGQQQGQPNITQPGIQTVPQPNKGEKTYQNGQQTIQPNGMNPSGKQGILKTDPAGGKPYHNGQQPGAGPQGMAPKTNGVPPGPSGGPPYMTGAKPAMGGNNPGAKKPAQVHQQPGKLGNKTYKNGPGSPTSSLESFAPSDDSASESGTQDTGMSSLDSGSGFAPWKQGRGRGGSVHHGNPEQERGRSHTRRRDRPEQYGFGAPRRHSREQEYTPNPFAPLPGLGIGRAISRSPERVIDPHVVRMMRRDAYEAGLAERDRRAVGPWDDRRPVDEPAYYARQAPPPRVIQQGPIPGVRRLIQQDRYDDDLEWDRRELDQLRLNESLERQRQHDERMELSRMSRMHHADMEDERRRRMVVSDFRRPASRDDEYLFGAGGDDYVWGDHDAREYMSYRRRGLPAPGSEASDPYEIFGRGRRSNILAHGGLPRRWT